jgi:hypothetical protein
MGGGILAVGREEVNPTVLFALQLENACTKLPK